MLSVMLACAFVSRQFWGAFADRFGGLRTVMAGLSPRQMLANGSFLLTREEVGLFAIARTVWFGFSGIIPSYPGESGIRIRRKKRRGVSRPC